MDSRAIGIFDSGLGGLTVWREVRKLLSDESLVYLGDGANCPYGTKSNGEIQVLADAAVQELLKHDVKLIVVACNTATAAAIDFLRTKYPNIPIVGMEPAVKPAALATRTGVIGVVATERSLDGELFRHTARKYGEHIEVLTAVGEGFVELVEENKERSAEAEAAVRKVIEPLLERGADQIVLGCTHYPFLIPVFEKILKAFNSKLRCQAAIVDPSPAVARRVEQLLDEHDLRNPEAPKPDIFLTFADDDYLQKLKAKAQ